MSKVTVFAKTNFRGEEKSFGIKREDRRYHAYVIGKTGTGKTTLLLNMMLSDVFSAQAQDKRRGILQPFGHRIPHIP